MYAKYIDAKFDKTVSTYETKTLNLKLTCAKVAIKL